MILKVKWYHLFYQRARLLSKVKLTEKPAKVQKNVRAPYYMATPEEKQIDMHLKMEKQMYFSKNIPRLIQWW